MLSYVARIRTWWTSTPLPRLRSILLGLYLFTAFADALGKTLAATPAFNRALASRVAGGNAEEMREAARPSGNFEIFRTASQHLVEGRDLYAEYPELHSDRFKYSPSFAMLFAPFAWLPWPLALFLWSSLNAIALFIAVERVVPGRRGLLAVLILHLEVLRGMQNAQSNAIVAALMILAYAALEHARIWRAATAIALGACVKIFPLAALTLAVPKRLALRTGVAAGVVGSLLIALPLALTSRATLIAQYVSWRGVEASDAKQRWFSVMELLHRWVGESWPNWPVQLAGTLMLLAPLALGRARWQEHRFRLLYLCSVLLYVVLFNHQAERASFLIAFAGIAIWYADSSRERWRDVLFAIAFVTIPLMSTLVPGQWFRTQTAMLYRLAGPTLAVWVMIQWEMLRKPTRSTSP